jgi:hypothetical protein
MTDDLTIDAIIRRVIESGRALESCESTAVRVTDERGQRSEIQSRSIQVGNDGYEWSSKRRGRLWGNETLTYRGREYFNDDEGHWKSRDEIEGHALVGILEMDVESSGGWDESLVSPIFHVDFNRLHNARRLPDETFDGQPVIRLTASESLDLPAAPFEEMKNRMPFHLMREDDQRRLSEKVDEAMSRTPETISFTHDLWIDPESFRLMKMEIRGVGRRSGRTISSFQETRVYSKFNGAELPGPLPD